MTITVKLGTDRRRWFDGIQFTMDKSDIRTLTLDYSGELGTDTVSSVSTSDENLTTGTPAISSNVVTISISAVQEGSVAYTDVTMTTTAGDVISTKVRIKGVDR
jgi:hypothetical protein